jgi:ABC-type glutathione transport system ATPase component
MSLADTIVVLEDGRIAQSGSPEALLANEGYLAKLGLVLRDGEPSQEHAENIRISRVESTLAESFISAPAMPDDTNGISDTGRKSGDWSVYGYYFSNSGRWVVAMSLISMAIWIFCTEFASTCTKPDPNI